MYDYDFIVIGGGVAGISAALFANSLGKKVTIIEKDKLGGNCSNRTCLPKIALSRAASVAKNIKECRRYGIKLTSEEYSTSGVMGVLRSVIEKVHEMDSLESFEDIGIDIIEGSTYFKDKHKVIVGEKEVTSDKFIITSGTIPLMPKIKGLKEVPFMTSENLYDLKELPETAIILGGGPAGIELASTLCRLGVRISVLEMADKILSNEDEEMTQALQEYLEKEGIKISTGHRAIEALYKDKHITIRAEDKSGGINEVSAEALLLMLGRKPNIESLALENAGVKTNDRGILVNRNMETSCKGIYAAGDVVGPLLFAASAELQGIAAVKNAFLPIKEHIDKSNMTWVTFTKPQLARSGLTEVEARKIYHKAIKVYRYEYKNVRRAIAEGKESGKIKIICCNGYKILGVHILGENAEEMIHELHLMRLTGIPLHKLHSIPHAYPTYSEAVIKRLGDMCYTDKMSKNIFVRAALKIYPGLSNKLLLIKEKL